MISFDAYVFFAHFLFFITFQVAGLVIALGILQRPLGWAEEDTQCALVGLLLHCSNPSCVSPGFLVQCTHSLQT